MKSSGSYSSKYTSSKRYVTSTEISYADHKAKSSYQKESTMEYTGPRGTTSSTKELITATDIRTLPVYIAIREYKPDPKDKDALPLEEGQIVEVLDQKNPSSWLVRTKSRPPQTGWVPGSYFETPAEYYRQKRTTREIIGGDLHLSSQEESLAKRDTVFAELLKTEEEFVQDLHHIINSYVKIFDDPSTPSIVRQLREQLTLNLRELYNFHANVLLKGLQYYSDNPGKVGQTFVRLERDFDQHVRYCRDEPDTEKLLEDSRIKEHIQKIIEIVEKNTEKDMKFVDYLRLPIKRLQQYQSYIKELIKYTARADLDTESLQKALELVLSIPQRATDLNYIRNIQDFPGDTVKLGRLLRHDQFKVWENEKTGDGETKYVFLFKGRMVFTDKHEPEDLDEFPEFKFKNVIRMDKYDIKEDKSEPDLFVLTPLDSGQPKYFLKSMDSINSEFIKQAWIKDVQEVKEGLTGAADEGPPRKKPKSPPAISPSASSGSLYSSTGDLSGTQSGTLEMQGTRVTRTQYGFRTLQESSAKMCLKVSGYPLPVITWFKDGVQLNEDERHKFYSDDDGFFAMTIDPVQVEDTGRYTCVATNEYGQATTSAFFRVVKAEREPQEPKFVTAMHDIEIDEGESARFECDIEGWPEPEIQFFIDGHLVHPSHDFRIEYDGQKAVLQVNEAQPEDSGTYSIKISNEIGSAECKANLRVKVDPEKNRVAPEFQQTIDNKVVDEGDTVKFKVVCTGDPAPEVFWSINGTLLTESENIQMLAEDGIYILTIKDITTHFDGEITCQAKNRLGEASCSAHLTVRVRGHAPKFDQSLVDQSLTAGDRVKIEAIVSAQPEATVYWYLDGKPIKESDGRFRLTSLAPAGIFGLEIISASDDMNGTLECHAENDFGEVVSKAKLTVVTPTPAPKIKFGLRDVTLTEDDALKLQVVTEEDIDSANVKWILNGKELKTNWNISVSKTDACTFSLEISKIAIEHTGPLKCVVTNESGHDETLCHIYINQKTIPAPNVTRPLPKEVKIKEWENLRLEVEIESDSQPNRITWFLSGKELKDDSMNVKINTSKDYSRSTLEISRISSDQSGKITCKIDNRCDSTFTDSDVTVQKRPTRRPSLKEQLPESVIVKVGEPLTLTVTSTSSTYEEQVTWKVNNKDLPTREPNMEISNPISGQYQLKIEKVTSEMDNCSITCKISNEIGTSESSTTIKIDRSKELEEEAKRKREEEEKLRKEEEEKRKREELLKEEEERLRREADEKRKEEEDKLRKEEEKKREEEENERLRKEEEERKRSEEEKRQVEEEKLRKEEEEKRKRAEEQKRKDEEEELERLRKLEEEKEKLKRLIEEQEKQNLAEELEKQRKLEEEERKRQERNLEEQEKQTKLAEEQERQRKMEEEARKQAEEEEKYKQEATQGPEKMDYEVEITQFSKIETVTSSQINPNFVRSLSDALISTNETVTFQIQCSGVPSPEVTWFLNGKLLQNGPGVKIESKPDEVHILELNNLTPKDSGEVECHITNPLGEKVCKSKLVVVEPGQKANGKPVFQVPLSPVDVAEGETLKAKVIVTGDQPRVKWYANNQLVVKTDDVTMTSENNIFTLEIVGSSPEMNGTLKCVAYNSRGEISCTAPITVTQGVPVEFEQYLCDTSCHEGDTLRLKAVLLGEPAPSVTWFINGKQLEESQNIKIFVEKSTYMVVIKDITCDMSGEVLCKAVNEFGEASSSAYLHISPRGVPPDFTEWLSNLNVKEGSTVTHKVVFTGQPTPNIVWYINNREITNRDENFKIEMTKDTCTLTIKKFTPDLVGEIICKAENDAGEVSCTANMNLFSAKAEYEEYSERSDLQAVAEGEELSEAGTLSMAEDELLPTEEETSIRVATPIQAPKFITKLKDVKVRKGQKAIFECVVPDTKGVCVKWLKDGKEIELLARIRVCQKPGDVNFSQFYQLIIESVTKADKGVYTCVISNDVGESSSLANLEVTDSITEELVADFAPEFTKNLASCTVVEGQPAFLECRVKGEPAPTVEWYKGDKKLYPDGTLSIQSTPDGVHRLIITKTTAEDSCTYRVKVSNVKGFVTQEAKITVEGVKKAAEQEPMEVQVAPQFVQELETVKIDENDQAVLECRVVGEPAPLVQWFKEEEKIDQDSRHKIESADDGRQKLIIDSASTQDIGHYICKATNVTGFAQSEAELLVKSAVETALKGPTEIAPEFIQPLENAKVGEGQLAVLQCIVDGRPPPEVLFYKGDQKLTTDEKHKVEKVEEGVYKLVIFKADGSDIGEYKAVATNVAGKKESKARLDVKLAEQKEISAPEETAPEFVKHLTTYTVNVGDVAVFECKIKGEPAPEIHWFKDGKEVKMDVYHRPDILPDGRAKLTIDHATELDVGSYTVEVTNKAGKAVSEGRLIVKVPEEHIAATSPEAGPLPEFSADLSTYKVEEGEPVTLECKVAEAQPRPDVSWYKGEEKLETSQEHKIISTPDGRQALTISQTETSDSGAYSVEIKVGQVRSTTDGYLEVSTTKEMKRTGQAQAAPEFVEILRTAQCSIHEQAIFQCKVSGLPKPEVKWSRDGEELFASDTVIMESLEDGTHKLILKDVTASALGEYRCDAVNTAGAAWSEAPLVLKSARQSRASLAGEIAPDFLEPLRAVVAEEGQEVGMVCKVIGVPAPEVKWFKNGEPLHEAMTGVDQGHWELVAEDGGVHRLLLHNVSSTDVAEYRCQATNEVGIVWSDATLTLKVAQRVEQPDIGQVAPYFIRALTNAYEANVSETLRLECQLSGAPRPQVRWYKDDREVRTDENLILQSQEDGTQTLTLRKASKADVGKYICEATNILGVAKTYTSVAVFEPMEVETHEEFAPEFDQELRECHVDEGQSATFECHVLGQPAPVVRWFKDGQKVDKNDRIKLEMLPDGRQRLSISEAKAEDQGNYRCEATNIVGSMSSKAPLTVRVAEEMEIERSVAPEFTIPLHEVKVREGVSAHFECALSETRGVKVQWFKDGKLLSPSPEYIIECAEDGRQTLIVYKTKSEDIGHYYCVATSPVGKAQTEADLQVLEGVLKPEFNRGLKNVKVKSSELVALSCQIDMTKLKRLPTVKWYKNGVELLQDKRVLLTVNESGQCNMLISQTTEEDTGVYKCEITNDAGSSYCEAEVSVQLIKPPDFLSSLNDQVVNEGQNLELEVKVSGAPFPDVKWLKDGKEVKVSGNVKLVKEEDTGTVRLVLEDVKPEDEGTYRCIVSNIHGTASAKASIEVKPCEKVEEKFEVPQFVRGLQNVHVPEGEDVALTCQISGQPSPDVIWYKGNVPIKKDDQKYTITSDESGLCICRIRNISPSDSASYTCKLISPAGSVESSAELTVEAKIVVQPPEFKRAMQDRRTSAKSSVAFEIEVNTSDVAVQWFENGSEVNANHKHLIEQVSSTVFRLIVKDVDERTDAGEYQCQVSNVAGTAVSKGNLFVEGEKKDELIAPKFARSLEDKKVKQGQKLVLEAEVEGKPRTVKWYKAGNELKTSGNVFIERIDDTTYRLTVNNVSADDTGSYTVEATNDFGTAASQANVVVETFKFPQITKYLKDVDAEEGSTGIFEVEVSGKPDSIKWYKNGQELHASARIRMEQQSDSIFRLVIDGVNPDDVADYKFLASNPVGAVSSEAALTIKRVVPAVEKPLEAAPTEAALTLKVLKSLEDRNVDEHKPLNLEVELSSAPTLLKWYKGPNELKEDANVKIESLGNNVHKLIILNTTVDDAGLYRVVASNEAGTVTSEAKVIVQTVEEKPKIVKGLTNTEALVGSPVFMEIEVAKKPKVVKWYKNGQELSPSKHIVMHSTDDTHYRLIIPESEQSDEADYKVKVENDAGSDESDARLTIRKSSKPKTPSPPKEPSPVDLLLTVVRGLDDKKCTEEDGVTFEVEFSGKPVDVKWYKKNQLLETGKNIQLESVSQTLYRLIMPKVKIDDAGSYRVEAANKSGEKATSSAVLTIQTLVKAPEVLDGLKNLVVDQGAQAVLEVHVKGKPTVVKWYKNGVQLNPSSRISIDTLDDSHFRLTLLNADLDDEGQYKVHLENEAGSVDSEAALTVRKVVPRQETPQERMETEAALTITKILKDQSVKEGDNAGFDVEFSSSPTTIKWYKNNQLLSPSDHLKMIDLGGNCFRLLLTDVQKEEHEALYKVEAERDGHTVDSTAKLTVEGQAPRILKPLKDCQATRGSKIILETEVEGKPKIVKWYRNGREIKETGNVKLEEINRKVFRLIFNEVQKDDEASYKIVLSNDFGSCESEGRLTVEEILTKEEVSTLKFVRDLTDKTVVEGSHVSLEVEVEGKPKSVKWYKNGRLLNESEKVRIEQLSQSVFKLMIMNTNVDDQGEFKVVVENDVSRIESQGTLRVESARPTHEAEGVGAKFTVPLTSQTGNEDETISLTCKVRGEPYPEIAWLKDGVEIEKSPRIDIKTVDGLCTLLIKNLKRDDAGTYTCLAQNVHGGDRTKCTVNVEAKAVKSAEELPLPPEFVKPLRDKTVIEGEDVILEVKIVGKPMPEVCWFMNNEEIEPSDRIQGRIECVADEIVFRLYIKNARLSDSNLYRCTASNIHGRASTQGKLTVEVLKPAEQSPPRFVIPIVDTSAVEGKSAIFDVKVRGRPTPELIWYKNSKEIIPSDRIRFEGMGDNRFRMTIENLTSEDAGLYACKAVNSLGSDFCQGNLAISPSKDRKRVSDDRFAPIFNVPLHDRRIPEGNNMIVECFVNAKPRADIKWFKDDYQLEDDDRVHIESYPDGKCRLRINDFTEMDAGTYKCVASNELGSSSTSANLNVEAVREDEIAKKKEYAPRFVKDLTDTKVKEGDKVTLECKVDGVPFPEIRWFKNGIPIKPDDENIVAETFDDGTCKLTIIQARESDMGAFRCLARNIHGSTNCACLLAVETSRPEKKKEGEGPIFLKGLSDCWVDKGSDVILKCQVSGEPRPTIKWYKDGTLIRANDRLDLGYLDDGTVILTIRDSTFSDEGFYRCSAENPFGEVSTIGTVRIQALTGRREVTIEEGEQPKFIIPLEDKKCSEGGHCEFECKVTGKPPPQLKWYKDGSMLLTDYRCRVESLGDDRYRLSLDNVTSRDEGNYRCVAINDSGTATSKATLSIDEGIYAAPLAPGAQGPQFTVPLRDIRGQEGNPLELECKVSGEPMPEITWFKDGEPLTPSDRIKMDLAPDGTARLRIDSCRPSDEGLYRCVARNPYGTNHVKSNVTIKGLIPSFPPFGVPPFGEQGKAPRVVIPLDNVRSREGHPITLSCRIVGSPQPLIKWFKDGERLYPFGRYSMDQSDDGTVTLTIDQLTTRDTGCYRCIGENDFGSDRTTAELVIEAKEKRPRTSLDDEIAKGRAPGFIKPLVIQRTHEGQQAIFTCLPYGNPFPKIKWLKDGVELQSNEKFTIENLADGTQRLIIKNCLPNDDGYYRCVASNDYGTSSTKAELIIEIDYAKKLRERYPGPGGLGVLAEEDQEQKPRFKKGLQNITVGQGSTAEFECAVVGNPKPLVKWFKNREPITPGGKYMFWQDDWGFHRLIVLNAQLDDQDDYRCEISNRLGSAESTGSLHILKEPFPRADIDYGHGDLGLEPGFVHRDRRLFPPGFLRQIRNRHVFAGFPAVFDCIVTGNPVPEITWLRNGQPIKPDGRIKTQICGGNSYALIFLRTVPEDQGEYTCLATNTQGSISSSAVLEVTVPMLDKMSFDGRYSPWLADETDFRKVPYSSIPVPPDRGPFIAEVTGHYLTLSWIPTLRPPPRYPQITYIVEMRELPDKGWTVVDFNISQPCCKVRNLELGKSYQFRVRAENIYGISDPSPPSPPSQLMAPPKPVLDKWRRPIPNFDPYAVEALNRCYAEQYACAPWFAPRQMDKMYCAENQTLEIVFWVYGYPDPEVKWYFRGWEITNETHGRRFESKCYGGTECVLTIKHFSAQDVGQYQCKAVNQHGDAQQNVLVDIATMPTFIHHLDNKVVPSSKTARLDCRVDATPFPEIKWFKDWHPIVESSRVKMVYEPPYLCSLLIENPVLRDSGIYTCAAVNEAGRATSTATLTIEIDPYDYGYDVDYVRPPKKVALAPRKVREIYTIEEEILNISGGQLLDRVTSSDSVPETQIAFFIRQLLQALQHMHNKNIVHLDLRPENIMLSENGTDQIKLSDFGLSRRLRRDKSTFGTMGSPEFVAPEIVQQRPVTLSTDMWSVGVLAYVMLTGVSPFHGDNDKETLQNVVNVKYSLGDVKFDKVSPEAKDFIAKLLVFDQNKRLSATAALSHPWMQISHDKHDKAQLLTTHFLKEFNYRHKWVERRVFIQYGPDDDQDLYYNNNKHLPDLEPIYIPLLTTNIVAAVDPYVAATVPLKLSAQYPRSPNQEALTNPTTFTPEESLAVDRFLSKAEHRSIEEELANRILSDISEEGSVVSEDVGGYIRFTDQLAMEPDAEPLTPIPESASQSSSIRRPLKIDVDDSTSTNQGLMSPTGVIIGAKGQKSPVIVSPKMERTMSCKGTVTSPKSSPLHSPVPRQGAGHKQVFSPTNNNGDVLSPLQKDQTTRLQKIDEKDLTIPPFKGHRTAGLEDAPKRSGLRLPPQHLSTHGRSPGTGGPLPSEFDRLHRHPMTLTDVTLKDRIIREVENYDWDTEYQMGPETFLMQHRDADFAARIRDYRRRLFGDTAVMLDAGYLGAWNRDVSVRERRRYTDFLKSDKDAQRMIRVLDQDMQALKTGAAKRAQNLQVLPAPLPKADGSCAPIFFVRLCDMVFSAGGEVLFQCSVVGNPKPQVSWFHDEAIVVDDPRHKMSFDAVGDGKAALHISDAQYLDSGLYKCVATNEHGQTCCVARLKVGEYAARCTRPDVMLASDTEVFITWEPPYLLGGLSISGYKLEYRTAGENDFSRPWIMISDNLDEESVVVKHLEPLGIYQFRVTAKNVFGFGEPSPASRMIQTHNKTAPKLNLDLLKKDYHFNVISLPQSGALGDIMEEDAGYSECSTLIQDSSVQVGKRRDSRYSLELNTKDDPQARYQLDSEIFRGRFCSIRNAVDIRCETRAHCAAKICSLNLNSKGNVMREYEILKLIQHTNVVQLLNAFMTVDFLLMFIEKLQEDLLDRFTYADYYTEDHITRVLGQILSALQWIHFKRICFLDLRPDNLMFASKRVWLVKLCDTGSALTLPSNSLEAKIPAGHLELEYSAPEVLQLETFSTATDIWGLGILTFLLLSGTHPFCSEIETTDEELKKNIIGEKCDINFIFTNASQEALRFVTWCLKKQSNNRMNTEEGLQHKWLSLLDVAIKRRENIKFSANNLRKFAQSYRSRRASKAAEDRAFSKFDSRSHDQ